MATPCCPKCESPELRLVSSRAIIRVTKLDPRTGSLPDEAWIGELDWASVNNTADKWSCRDCRYEGGLAEWISPNDVVESDPDGYDYDGDDWDDD